MNKIQQQLFYRSFELDRATVNKEERSVDLAFSSETPLERWFGKEILLHGTKNVDLTRLKTMGSALMNHDPNFILGSIREARIENRRGKAKVFFDDDEDGNKALFKVESGSLRGVSFGYLVQKFVEIKDGEEYQGFQGPAHIATRWMPYEISLTPIPADATVGVGRDMTRSLDGISIQRLTNKKAGGKKMDRDKPVLDEKQREQLRLFMNVAKMIEPENLELRGQLLDDFAYDFENCFFRLNQKFAEFKREGFDRSSDRKAITSFEQVEDVDFFRGLTNPGMSFDKPDKSDRPERPARSSDREPVTSFDQVDDDAFFKGLTNPH